MSRADPGNAAGASFHRGKRILRPGSWQGWDVAARYLLLSRLLRDSLPNWGPRRRESSVGKPGLDGRHRNKDREISGKHGNTLVRTLRKVYGQGFAAGYPETAKLSEVMFHLNETSLNSAAITRRTTWSTRLLRHRNEGASLSSSGEEMTPVVSPPCTPEEDERLRKLAWTGISVAARVPQDGSGPQPRRPVGRMGPLINQKQVVVVPFLVQETGHLATGHSG